jgi:maltooligosyltrehalose trehalohydrolase
MQSLFGPRLGPSATEFRLWAPSAQEVHLILENREPLPLQKGEDDFWTLEAPDCGTGTRYKFQVGDLQFPDPASRQQSGGTSGWSLVTEPLRPSKRTEPLRPWHETLICEVHVGTATPEGTFSALTEKLEHFRDAGYTALEIMPINTFPGSRNWGYDGTLVFAPAEAYGTREELRQLVDRAHELGLCLILDVVYNHFGDFDNFLARYAPEWFDPDVKTPWGPGVDYTEEVVRQFYYENACMWLSEFDFDGLRFDAVHEMKTDCRDAFLGDLAKSARSVKHHAKLILENMDNAASWLQRDGAHEPIDFTAQWDDDIHHVLHFLVTGEPKAGYEEPDRDPIADLIKGLADGFIHDGEADGESDGHTRGEPGSELQPDAFVAFVQNHDQIGNRADASRLASRVSAEKLDFLHFVLMLAPQTPLFFMGEEAHMRTPFPYFIDLPEEAAAPKREDRYVQMREIFLEEVEDGALPDPNDEATFLSAKIDWSEYEREDRRAALDRFRTLAKWRKEQVWPLMTSLCRDARTGRQDKALCVSWIFTAGTLTMALNPSDTRQTLACNITSDTVMSTGNYSCENAVLNLDPWSAVAWVNPA